MAFEDYYAINPVSVIDQNSWDDKIAEVSMQFIQKPLVFTPLVDWTDESARTGALNTIWTELLEGDINSDPIDYDLQYLDEALGVDSRSRTLPMARYGDKVQLKKSSNYFQQFQLGGGRDWTPVLRGVLGNSVIRKMELVSRNAFLSGPQSYWTYSNGKANFGQLSESDTFNLEPVNAWNLRLGNTGSPVVPGRPSNEKVVILPPGAVFDFQNSLAASSANEARMWVDARMYSGKELRYEIGAYKNTSFIESPNDNYGLNPSVLYNAGVIAKQVTVTVAINPGDGSPDPETTDVDGTWRVGQKDRTHYIQCSAFTAAEFKVNDIVSIHTLRTSNYGVTNGVNFMSGKTIVRRVVAVDDANNRLSFDRPIMNKYTTDLGGGVYAYVTKAQHIGFGLAVAGRGGVKGNLNKPLEFYDPKPIDDFNSVFRFTWDMIGGIGTWEPNLFEPHFFAVTLPKPGGLIQPFNIS